MQLLPDEFPSTAIARLPQQPKTADRFMIRATLARVFKLGRSPQSRAVERAKRLARSTDPFTRAALARAASTPPELLYYLVRDADVMVRRAVAGNPNTPRQADIILAMDDDPEVRRLVAGKITNQLSHLSKESVQLWALTLQVLDSLAKDNLPEVRRLIAESGRTVEKVPSSIMTRLSRDLLADVAVPALEYMGKIRDADLVEIVTARPDQRIIGAVARRPAIGPTVSEAVVAHGDEGAIGSLLENSQAVIAPETINQVVDRAQKVESWHPALVARPDLPDSAVMRLATFVADRLIPALQRRNLDPETSTALAQVSRQRLPAGPAMVETITPEVVDVEGSGGRARRHFNNGTLTEDVIVDAMSIDRDFVVTALALRAKLPEAVVHKILSSSSAKGLTALAWKAGYSMRLSLQLQLRVARLPPKARLNPENGSFPMAQSAMDWQIDFFKSLV